MTPEKIGLGKALFLDPRFPASGMFSCATYQNRALRNIALTAPYFHSGKVWDLSVAVEIMAESQLGETLKPEETAQIVAFLESLTGALPPVTLPVLPPETAATPRPTSEIQ